ncbi:hypothetical protein MRB53_038972 [Persea americana]|nr:hypothetical protein MRB53_038972 [Persea americana]
MSSEEKAVHAELKASTIKGFMNLIERLAHYNVCDGDLFDDRRSQQLLDHRRHDVHWREVQHARECVTKAFEIRTFYSSRRDHFLTYSAQPQQINRATQPFTSNLIEATTSAQARHSSINPFATPAKQPSRIGTIATPSKRPHEGMGQESAAKRVRAASPQSDVPWSEMPSSPTPWSSSSFQAQLSKVNFTMEVHGFVRKDMMNYLRHIREGGLWCRCRPQVAAEYRTATEDGEVLNVGEGYWACHIKKSRKLGAPVPCGFWLEHKKFVAIQRYLEDHGINVTQDERYLVHGLDQDGDGDDRSPTIGRGI